MPFRVKNISAGFYDANGVFHPIRAASDYVPETVNEDEKYKTPRGRKGAKAKAKRAEQIAKEARARARERAKAEKEKAKLAAAKKAKKAVKKAKKKNPIPTNRYVTAKIRRTRSGDLKVILPLK